LAPDPFERMAEIGTKPPLVEELLNVCLRKLFGHSVWILDRLIAGIFRMDLPKCPVLMVNGPAFINIDVLISQIDNVK
jgi:hypothetical protein